MEPDTRPASHRSVSLSLMGEGRFKATNRRGGVLPIGGGDDPDFTPVELLLAALAGCAGLDVDAITGKRVRPDLLDVECSGEKVRDEHGNRMTDLRVTVRVEFPDGEAGDRVRQAMPRTLAQVRDRLCTVVRTVSVGTQVEVEELSPR